MKMMKISNTHGDEIELIDILKVLWKWKYLIITVSLICGLVIGTISYSKWKNKPLLYKASMVLQPELSDIDNRGRKQFVYSIEDFQILVEVLLNYRFKENDEDKLIGSNKIKTSIPKDSNVLIVSCVTKSSESGIRILNKLLKRISEKVREDLIILNKEEIAAKKIELKNTKAAIERYDKQIKIVNDRINELKFILEHHGNDKKLDSNESEQFMVVENQYRNDIYLCLLEKESINFNLRVNLTKIDKIRKEIDKKREELDEDVIYTELIRIITPPESQPVSRKNRTKLIAIVGCIIGLLFMVFLVFFIEYIKNASAEKDKSEKG